MGFLYNFKAGSAADPEPRAIGEALGLKEGGSDDFVYCIMASDVFIRGENRPRRSACCCRVKAACTTKALLVLLDIPLEDTKGGRRKYWR